MTVVLYWTLWASVCFHICRRYQHHIVLTPCEEIRRAQTQMLMSLNPLQTFVPTVRGDTHCSQRSWLNFWMSHRGHHQIFLCLSKTSSRSEAEVCLCRIHQFFWMFRPQTILETLNSRIKLVTCLAQSSNIHYKNKLSTVSTYNMLLFTFRYDKK